MYGELVKHNKNIFVRCIILLKHKEKRFEIAKKIYNALIAKSYHELTKTKKYRGMQEILIEYKNNRESELRKQSLKELNLLYKEYGFSEYQFHTHVKEFQHHFKKDIDSFTAQKLATNLWKSYEKLLYGNGNKIHYKKFDSFFSVEGKSNKTGIRFLEGNLTWLGLKISVVININNQYEQESLRNPISYCRIIRKFVRSRYKYYFQIVFNGVPPIKTNSKTNEIK